MTMEEDKYEFMTQLGLCILQTQRMQKKKKLTLHIDLNRPQTPDCFQRIPKTSCSMLSPLTPKLPRAAMKLDFDLPEVQDYTLPKATMSIATGRDPIHTLASIDICSPLGVRLIGSLLTLVIEPCNVCKDYDKYCNSLSEDVGDARLLRSFHGKSGVVFRRRLNHRYLNRPFYLKKSSQKLRRRLLLTGLSERSRALAKSLPKCYVSLMKLPIPESMTEDKCAVASIFERFGKYIPQTDVIEITNSSQESEQSRATYSHGDLNPFVRLEQYLYRIPSSTSTSGNSSKEGSPRHRKSFRYKKPPRRLIDSI